MTNAELREDMAKAIAARIMDPNGWNMELRVVAERLRLDVTRIEFCGVLYLSCQSVIDEARKQGRSQGDIQAAYR